MQKYGRERLTSTGEQPMRFEARDLKPYSEPVAARDLEVGAIYFSVTFLDDQMLLPCMEPLVFLGRNLETGDSAEVYFQDLVSYRQGILYEAAATDQHARFIKGSEDELGHVFAYEQALEVLMACSLRRSETS